MATKEKDLFAMDDEQLEGQLKEAKEELFNLRFQHATGQLDNPLKLRYLRRKIARILTLQKQLAMRETV